MIDAMKVLGAMFALVAMRLGAASWYILKATVLFAIVIGAGSEVLSLAPSGWPPLELSLSVLGEYIKLAFLTASNSWQIISLALLFYAVWALVIPFVKEIETHVYQTKVGVVAIGNYLEFTVDTDASKLLMSEGIGGFLRQGKARFLIWLLLGHKDDDSLSAKPVRWNSEVSLREDLKSEIKSEVEEASERLEASISDHIERQMDQLATQFEDILDSKLD